VTLVFAGVCSHGPGTTARAHLAEPAVRDPFFAALGAMRVAIEAARPDALIILAAEHFANFFMNNMPAFALGMAESYVGPVEDPEWLRIPRRTVAGDPQLSLAIITHVMRTVDVAYAEEWRFDHGIMVPLHFLDPGNRLTIIPANINCQGPPLPPLPRAWAFGEALRRACDTVPQRIALIGTGGLSHWPATPDSGRINAEWDRAFLSKWAANDRDAMLAYSDMETYRDAGQGGFEMRTYLATAAAAGGPGAIHYAVPIPVFATSAIVATMDIAR
jgi:aromatic ring-opening dioxygenase catalytic subunit (LigB family)